MSNLIIKKNIEKILKERGWRIADIENKIGKGRSVTNIIRGKSQNPTIEVLQSIASALCIDVQELLIDHEDLDYMLNVNLLEDTCNKIIKELKSVNLSANIKYSSVFPLIREAYEYSIQLSLNQADNNFIKWLIYKHYK